MGSFKNKILSGNMMGRNTTLHIVKASLEDEEGVMRASEDVYAGLDYLPSLYRTWIQEGDKEDPRRFNFVVQIDSEVGGFFSLLFIHDKTKFLSSARRVSKSHRAKGVGTAINEFTANFAKGVNRDVEKLISFADAWLEEESLKKKIRNEGGDPVEISAILMNFQPKYADNITGCNSNLYLAEENFLQKVLSPPWSTLLPNSFLHVNWDPYLPSTKEDVDYILSKRPTIVRDEDSFSIFSEPVSIPDGNRIGLDVYAGSAEKFLAHVRFQLKNFAQDRNSEEVLKLFIFAPKVRTKVLLDFLKKEMKILKENFLSLGSVEREYPTMYIC